ncbi:triadin-like [Notolabrus celidotus]|uniref:triadin-like n=1 Tax=Notolabrus celidotus TaxID=1203425 RepID=UPI00148F6C8F|nr:triadin-like [Notolabrus celidotus]
MWSNTFVMRGNTCSGRNTKQNSHEHILSFLDATDTEKEKAKAVKKEATAKKDKPKSPAVAKKEPAVKEKTKAAAAAKKEPAATRQKRKPASEKTEAAPVRSKAKASAAKKDAEPRPQPIRLRPRLESVRRANVTSEAKEEKPAKSEAAKIRLRSLADKISKAEKADKKSVKEAQDKEKQPAQTKEPQSEDNTTEKKKPGQRYFQCIYVPGKNAQYPLRPFTPAMTPAMMSSPMMSPAIRAMMEQQRAARAAGQ